MLTVVVDSFDGYSDLWPSFFAVFHKQWPDCPYSVRLISNEKTYDGVQTICTGPETCWSDRTRRALEQVDSQYVLLLLEDYLIGQPVDTKTVEEALAFLQEQDGRYLRLTNIPASRYHSGEAFFPLYADEEYAVNLQASIWRKDYLIQCLEAYGGNAWEFEVGHLKKAVAADHAPLPGCFGMGTDPLQIRNGVLKGKWFPKQIRYFARQGMGLQWQQRGKLSFLENSKYHLAVWLKDRLSYKMRKRVKGFLRKLGLKFVSDL